jgi:rhodanese-related sulfurtransferase
MPTPKRLTPQQVYERLQAPADNLILVDVRTRREWQREGHIEGAVLIPVDDLQAQAAQELPKDAEIILYCHSGARSYYAANLLSQIGYSHVSDLSGGLEAWERSRLPVARD